MSFKLSNIYITRPLNEAHEPNKYAIPEDILNGTADDKEKEQAKEELQAANQENPEAEEQQEGAPQQEEMPQEEIPQDDNLDQQPPQDGEMPPEEGGEAPADAEQQGGDELGQPVNNPDKDENGNDPTSVINDIENPDDPDNQEFSDPNDQAYDQEQMEGEADDMSMDDLNSEAQQTPGLHLLNSISDQQYQLLNSELYNKFIHLKTRVKESIVVDIDSLNPNTERLIQCKKIVSDNLHNMINDLDNFLLYTFNDTYESNVITYMKFMKRYQYALDIINRIKHNKNH